MSDITYEKATTELEIRWKVRIAKHASAMVDRHRGRYEDDAEGLQLDTTELLTGWLLNDTAWEHVTAADISDIAYEAIATAIAEQY